MDITKGCILPNPGHMNDNNMVNQEVFIAIGCKDTNKFHEARRLSKYFLKERKNDKDSQTLYGNLEAIYSWKGYRT